MKIIYKICFIVIFVIVILLVTNINSNSDKNDNNNTEYILSEEEPVIENNISLKAKEIHDFIRQNGYGYCTYDKRCEHEGNCGLNSTLEASKNGHHNTCCATYVSWVLQETGYITKKEHNDNNFNGANNLWKYLSKKGWKEITDKSDWQPGDILCYNNHIAIYAGKGARYDAGNKMLIDYEAPYIVNDKMILEKVLRAPDL